MAHHQYAPHLLLPDRSPVDQRNHHGKRYRNLGPGHHAKAVGPHPRHDNLPRTRPASHRHFRSPATSLSTTGVTMPTLTFDVTQQDIDNGKQKDPEQCPIALALKRTTNTDCLSVEQSRILINGRGIRVSGKLWDYIDTFDYYHPSI